MLVAIAASLLNELRRFNDRRERRAGRKRTRQGEDMSGT
jgi:hypothetical protein